MFELGKSGYTKRLRGVFHRLTAEAIDRPDWHNELAQLTLDIRSSLEHLPNAQKKRLLSRLKKALRSD